MRGKKRDAESELNFFAAHFFADREYPSDLGVQRTLLNARNVIGKKMRAKKEMQKASSIFLPPIFFGRHPSPIRWIAQEVEPAIFGTANKVRHQVAIEIDDRGTDIMTFDILSR